MSSEAPPPAPGLLLVLSAPSGAGKTTLARAFQARHPDARFSVSVTTRPPRGAERDGVDYHFVVPGRFDELVAEGALAEWAEVHGQRYGTLRSTVARALAGGEIALFDIDVQGGSQLAEAFPGQAVTVFVLPPSWAELERRLRGRSTEGQAAIAARLAVAVEETRRGMAEYHYLLVNDALGDALARLEAVVLSERAARSGGLDAEAARRAAPLARSRFDAAAWRAGAGFPGR
jgi:guanylate kinase